MAPSATSTPTRNRLLAALPPDDLARLWPGLEAVELPLRQVLHTPGTPIEAVYFPETGFVSMLSYLEDDDAAEVGIFGYDGFVGLPVLLGADHDDIEAMVQSPGAALRMDAQAFREALERIPALRTLLLRHALVHHGQVARTAACNGRHQIDQRLARWLLMSHDRAEGDDFPMTHEFLGLMLGVRRAGITVSVGQLQKAGFIRYEQGRIAEGDCGHPIPPWILQTKGDRFQPDRLGFPGALHRCPHGLRRVEPAPSHTKGSPLSRARPHIAALPSLTQIVPQARAGSDRSVAKRFSSRPDSAGEELVLTPPRDFRPSPRGKVPEATISPIEGPTIATLEDVARLALATELRDLARRISFRPDRERLLEIARQ